MAEISGKGIPTTKTAAAVGDYYTDTDTSCRYKCDLSYLSKDEDGKDIAFYKWSKVNTYSSGGGTTDYADLSNKPTINGVDLTGNKTTEDLKLVDKEAVKEYMLTHQVTLTQDEYDALTTKDPLTTYYIKED